MGPIENLAIIFGALIILKAIIFIINPRLLFKLSDKLFNNPPFIFIFYLILVGIVGYYIFTFFNIIGVAAVMLFTLLLLKSNLSFFPQTVKEFVKKNISKSRTELWKKIWFPFLIWVTIAIWALYKILI